jgi:hypothetical protein
MTQLNLSGASAAQFTYNAFLGAAQLLVDAEVRRCTFILLDLSIDRL